LNDKRNELAKSRVEIQKDHTALNRKLMTSNLTLDDIAKLYFPTKTAKTTNMIELRKIFNLHFNQNIGAFDLAYRVSVYTMRRTAATNVYKKLGIVHAKRFLNHTEIDTTMKYLNIDDDMEVLDYGL